MKGARTVGAALALAGAAVALSACGGGVVLQDDFAVQRTGAGPGSDLTLVVNDAGTATCNKAKPVPISDSQLVEARYINTTIEAFPSKKTTLAPQPQSVFHYFVQTGDGSVRFSDNSKNQPVVLRSLALLVLQIAQQDCHLSQ